MSIPIITRKALLVVGLAVKLLLPFPFSLWKVGHMFTCDHFFVGNFSLHIYNSICNNIEV